MKHNVIRLLSVLTMIAGLVSSAGATQGNGRCEVGELCLWHDINYKGAIIEFVNHVSYFPGYHYDNSKANVNDSVSSLINATGGFVRLTMDSYGKGQTLCVGSGIGLSNLKNVAWPIDNWLGTEYPNLWPDFNDGFSSAYFNIPMPLNVFNCDIIFFQAYGHVYEDLTQYHVWPYIPQYWQLKVG